MLWHEGQNNLLQVGVSLRNERKCFLSSQLKSILLRRILICSEGNSVQSLGKEKIGIREIVKFLLKGILRPASLRSSTSSWSARLIRFVIQMLLKLDGKNPWINCWVNCSLKKRHRSGNGNILVFLKRGAVWALYLESVTILMACFCFRIKGFSILSEVQLHAWIAYIKCEWNNAK